MLPSHFPGAHVVGFGIPQPSGPVDFDSLAVGILEKILAQRSSNGRQEKPIVFIGHGYGTMLIEKILFSDFSDSPRHPKQEQMVSSTAAIVLFGPPLRGFDSLAKWASQILHIPRSSEVFRNAAPSSRPERWKEFFKTTTERRISTVVFLEESFHTTSETDQECVTYIGTDFDLQNIAKFQGPHDKRFQRLVQILSDAILRRQFEAAAAAEVPDTGKIQSLIEAANDLNTEYDGGQTLLRIAAERGYSSALTKLLDSGKVDVNRQDQSGRTVLHSCATGNSNSMEMIEKLLEAGASPHLKDSKGKSPLDISNEDTRERLNRPVQIPSEPDHLVKGCPATEDANKACEEACMVVTEIFTADRAGQIKDFHVPLYTNVSDLIYTDQGVGRMFDHLHRPEDRSKPVCRWFHIPMNNVSVSLIKRSMAVRLTYSKMAWVHVRFPYSWFLFNALNYQGFVRKIGIPFLALAIFLQAEQSPSWSKPSLEIFFPVLSLRFVKTEMADLLLFQRCMHPEWVELSTLKRRQENERRRAWAILVCHEGKI